MPSSLLNELFPDTQISKTRSKINTYGSETMRPKGQVTLCCDRKGKIHMIDFLVVDLRYNKPPLLCGKDTQALDYLKIYAGETHAVEEKTPQNNASTTRKVDKGGRFRTLLQRIQARPQKTSWNPHAHLS